MTGRSPNLRPVADLGLRGRRPFWLPASNYYALAVAVILGTFFLLWGILRDSGDEMPWVGSGIAASGMIVAAVILREIILRRARDRYLAAERRFNRTLMDAYSRADRGPVREKLTIERNAKLLAEIKRKSEAAIVLSKYAEGHRDVFELCGEYLAMIDKEFDTVAPGSPRLPVFRNSRRAVAEFHRYHLLNWASIEARSLTNDANTKADIGDRVTAAQSALDIVDSALGFYPHEATLLDSRELIGEMLTSIKVSHWVERAERAEFDGNFAQAKRLYRDALFYLGREGGDSAERDEVAARICEKVDRLRHVDIGRDE